MGVLLAAVIVRLQVKPVSRRTLLLILMASILTVTYLCIEWVHFLAGRKTIDNLTDIRMIIYSSFYGSIVIFVLYAIYLTSLSVGQKESHLDFVIKLLSWCHIIFLCFWLLLYLGWIEPIQRADLLHSNSVSYTALFVLFVLLFYRDALELSGMAYKTFIAFNIAVIFLNETRGAILALIFIAAYYFMRTARNDKRALLTCILLGSLSGIFVFAAQMSDGAVGYFLGNDAGALGAVLNEITVAYERGESSIVVNTDIVSDESSLSAFSRIGSNTYAVLSFLDNPLLGIGQAETYSIKVLGSSVHSLYFLMADSTGILGMVLFATVVAAIVSAQNFVVISSRFTMLFLLFFGYVLLFNNSIPVYFSLIVTLLASQHQSWRSTSQSMGTKPGRDRRDQSIIINGNEARQL
jgi:hypothetical protein